MKTLPICRARLAQMRSAAALAAAPTDSKITAATVYLDRAVVTRTAAAELVPGGQELTFTGLPAGLVEQSLQVSGRTTARHFARTAGLNHPITFARFRQTTVRPRFRAGGRAQREFAPNHRLAGD